MRALSVLYVADRWDGPYRWRCRHAVEQLRLDGVAANTMHVDDPGLLAVLPSYAVVVLFRLAWSARVAALVDAARRQGATLVFDIDDLIFEAGAERLLPFFDDLPSTRQLEYLASIPRLRRTFDACDHFLGTTPVLVAHAERLGKPAFVHPNLVSDGYVRAGRVLGRLGRRLGRAPTIAYVSGSSTHDRDFRVVSEPLARILADDPSVRLLLCGFVTLPWSLRRFRDRITRLPYQDWRAYPFALATCRVALAPLATINDFTEGKSALKYLEAAAVGVPTVASPSAPFREAIRDGDTGFLAASEAEWLEAIRSALDGARSRSLGERAQREVRARFSFAAHRGELAALLGRLAGRSTGPAPARLATDPDLRTGGAGFLERARRLVALRRQQWTLLCGGGALPDNLETDRRSVAPRGPGAAMPLDPARFDRLLAIVREHGSGWVRDGAPVVRDLTAGGAWMPAGDARPGTAVGEYRSIGPDPQLLGPPLDLWKPPYRYLVVRMAASAAATRARCQFFWLADDASRFTESHSLRWTVELDGTLRSYVIDLHGTAWTQAFAIHRLRLDPVDCPGQVRVETMALIADLAQLESDGDLRVALARRYLHGRGIECGALQNPLPAPPDARVFFVDRLTEAQARAHYPELDGQPLARTALVGDVHRLPVRTGALDFCVANHLIEHAPDPIGALEELVRVVRPGGRLFVTVPDVVNPLDRHRSVTPFAHLLADHDPALDRQAEHLAHYREFVDSAHTEMNGADRDALLARWIGQEYSIHFHTFDEASYRRLLRHVTDTADAEVEEFVRNPGPDLDEHIAIVRRRAAAGARVRPPVTVIVVPSGPSPDAGACLDRVRRHAPHDAPILVLDGDLAAALDEASGRDVLLLGTDARVTAGFVERLQAAAHDGDGPAIASALDDAGIEGDQDAAGAAIDDIAAVVAAASPQLRPEPAAPATHCLYVPAAVLARVRDVTGSGGDTASDLVARARACGYPIRVADDAFVPAERPAPGGQPVDGADGGGAALDAVRRHLRGWLRRHRAPGPALLTLLHAPLEASAGETERHVGDLLATLRLPRAVVAVPRPDGIHVTEVFDGRLDDASRYRFPLFDPPPALAVEHAELEHALREVVRLFDVGAVHVQHFAGWPLALWRALRALDLPYVLTCHDHADRHGRELGTALHDAQQVVFPSPAARDEVARCHAIDPERVCVIPRSLDEMAQAYARLYEAMLAGRPPAPPLDLAARRALFVAGERGPRAANEMRFPHHSRWWYPYYRRVAAWTPAPVRRAGRRVVVPSDAGATP